MKKYVILILILFGLVFSVSKLNKTVALEELDYKYKIVSNSNSLDDLLVLYEVKELLVISYNNALENNLNIDEVYNSFSNYDIDLIDNTFVIVINNGEGISLEGKLKNSVCDNSTLNNRYALLEWLSNLK
jgi:hypothetical protein